MPHGGAACGAGGGDRRGRGSRTVADGVTGLLVPANDAPSLAAALAVDFAAVRQAERTRPALVRSNVSHLRQIDSLLELWKEVLR